MVHIPGNPGEIHELARYEVWQESAHPTRFVHIFCVAGRRSQPDSRGIGSRQEVCWDTLPKLPRPRRVHRIRAGRRQHGVPAHLAHQSVGPRRSTA